MPTLMKKVEVYCSLDGQELVKEVLGEWGVYWYSEEVGFLGEDRLCRITLYAPLHVLGPLISRVSGVLDLRRRENAIIVSDVESGLGAPYRITGRRFLSRSPGLLGKPPFMIVEEAIDRARVSPAQLLLAAISSLVALVGLLDNNPYVIIGAMLLSPILGPIYSFSILSAWRRHRDSSVALSTLSMLLAAAIATGLLASLPLRLAGASPRLTPELASRATLTPEAMVVAVLLGTASILAVSSSTWEALTGVAIAAALIPPAAALAYELVMGMPGLALKTAVNLAGNVVGLLGGGVASGLVIRRLQEKQSRGEPVYKITNRK